MENLEAVLARIRAIIGIKTDKQMAEFLKIPYSTINTWKDRQKIPKGKLLEIANIINTTPEYLLKGESTTISNNQSSVIIAGNNSGNIINDTQTEVSPELMEVIKLYKEYGNNKMLEKFKNEILKIKEAMEE